MPKPAPEMPTIQVTCQKCHWIYSSLKQVCPMCGAPMELKDTDLIAILQEYVDLQGIYIEKKEAKNFIKQFKKQYKRLPVLKELWDSALKLAKIEEMSADEVRKLQIQQKQREMAQAQAKKQQEIARVQAEKQQIEQQKLEEQQKKQAELMKKQQIPAQNNVSAKNLQKLIRLCPKCRNYNPSDSLFCNECGFKIGDIEPQPMPSQPMPSQPMPSQPMPSQPIPSHPMPSQINNNLIVKCPKCNNEIPPDSLFCMECGFKLNSSLSNTKLPLKEIKMVSEESEKPMMFRPAPKK